MKTIFLFSATALSILTQSPLLFGTDVAAQTQPFMPAPEIAIQSLTN